MVCTEAAYGVQMDLDLQKILPDGESAFVDVLLSDAQASQVRHLDRAPLVCQELESV